MKNQIDLSVAAYGDIVGRQFQLAILPWGATEPHNMHLPYTTDSILSHALCVDSACLAESCSDKIMMLPPINLGSQNPGQRELSFCIHARYETQFAILRDIVSSLHCQGIKKLLIVNGHGGNSFKNMIRDLAIDYPDFLIASCEWFKLASFHHVIENAGEHADELETSVMLYYHPEWVDMNKAGCGDSFRPKLSSLAEGIIWMPRNWSEISKDTGIGDPRKATAEKGRVISELVTSKLAEVITDLVTFN